MHLSSIKYACPCEGPLDWEWAPQAGFCDIESIGTYRPSGFVPFLLFPCAVSFRRELRVRVPTLRVDTEQLPWLDLSTAEVLGVEGSREKRTQVDGNGRRTLKENGEICPFDAESRFFPS